MTSERDYYDVLGIPRDADAKTIKDAYHRLAMKWHPDRNSAPEAEERFKQIAKAYAVLSDPKKRAKYDARGFEGVAHYTSEDLFSGLDLGSLFGDLGFGFGPGGDSVFDRFFHHARREPARGKNLHARIEVPLEMILNGGEERVSFTRAKTCTSCHGYGTADGQPPPTCPACGGSGHKTISQQQKVEDSKTIHLQQIITCPECSGRGTLVTAPCPACGGTGQVAEPETLLLHIPKGIEEGMRLRVPGYGLSASLPGVDPGDLLVEVYSRPDSRFQRRGVDLWRSESLYPDEAVLGARHIVPTLEGNVEVKIPPGAQPDEVLRLRGKGLPRYDHRGRGDLNIRLQVQIPTDPTDKEKQLYQTLQTERTKAKSTDD